MDFILENHGSLFLLRPLTDDAQFWIDENIGCGAQFLGDAVAIEHRYARDIHDGIINDGLTIEVQ